MYVIMFPAGFHLCGGVQFAQLYMIAFSAGVPLGKRMQFEQLYNSSYLVGPVTMTVSPSMGPDMLSRSPR